jgi:hypothetical protein
MALADPPVVEAATAQRSGDTWRFDVTLRHPDTGWDHYADAWRVLDTERNELAIRVLTHPHETEQPFTRSLSGLTLLPGTTEVLIEPRCIRDGWSGSYQSLELD